MTDLPDAAEAIRQHLQAERRAERAEAALAAAQDRMRLCSGPCHGVHGDEYVKTATEELAELRADLAAERDKQERRLRDPKKGEWKRKYFQARADLDAERAKRCATCAKEEWLVFRQEWDCPIQQAAGGDEDFSCSEWQPREATT